MNYLNNEFVKGSGSELESLNPFDGSKIWQGQSADKNDVDLALKNAQAAFPAWAMLDVDDRINIIKEFLSVIEANQESLANTISLETGKPLWETKTEVAATMGKIQISIDAYFNRSGTTQKDMPAATSFIRHKPHGVVAVFGPYNFPAHLPNGHIIPALIAGNVVVFKPSEQTPLVAQTYMEFWQKTALPKGVLQMLQGERECGQALAGHEHIDGLFFTGSSKTGHLLHSQFSGQPGKILALEMGGNNPLIIDENCELKPSVYFSLISAFISSGQRCTCARRILIPKGEFGDLWLNQFVNDAKKMSQGKWNDENQPFMGTVISKDSAKQLLDAQDTLINQGANALLTMKTLNDQGTLLSPSILEVTGLTNIADEEFFGPMVKIYRYDDLNEAIEIANDTKFGLSAGIFTNDKKTWQRFFNLSKAGIVNWNQPLTGASSAAPFGGIGASGNHRASALYAADYCSYPVASMEVENVSLPKSFMPGINTNN